MSKPGGDPSSGISLGDVLRLPRRHPADRRREAQPDSCTERENLTVMPREKAQAAPTARPKVPMRRRGADCLVVPLTYKSSPPTALGPNRLQSLPARAFLSKFGAPVAAVEAARLHAEGEAVAVAATSGPFSKPATSRL